jgi:hypothetical protein
MARKTTAPSTGGAVVSVSRCGDPVVETDTPQFVP